MVWDERARLWRDGALVTGGSPWGLVRLAPAARAPVRRLRAAGPSGLVPRTAVERAAVDLLVDRGVVHPVVEPRPLRGDVTVVVPAHDRIELLEACLRGLAGCSVVVVDDASSDPGAVLRVVRAAGAGLVRHAVNRGPGAARTSGLAAVDAPLVAFLDSDCVPTAGWLERLVPHFDDPRVGVVAPRVRPRPAGRSLLARHEEVRSALDMGQRRALVRPGGPLGFLPAAALLVRREALGGRGFDANLRVGEDVDLVWRLVDEGWHARYEPAAEVHHETRLAPAAWARRRFDYGTSAAELDRRHPGRLPPARLSGWNLLGLVPLLAGRLRLAGIGPALALLLAMRRLCPAEAPPRLAAYLVGKSALADAEALGHALRREWWPLGWAALATAPRSRWAAAGALSMLVPPLLEHRRDRPDVDLLHYLGLRLAEDAAYGSGAILGAIRHRRPGVVVPKVRFPFLAAPPPEGRRRLRPTRGR